MWVSLGRPSPFALIEYGADRARSALAILDGLRRHGSDDLLGSHPIRAGRVQPVPSGRPSAAIRTGRPGRSSGLLGPGRLCRRDGLGGARARHGVILANEFLDALPVHRVVVRGGKLLELFVVWRNGADGSAGRFAEVVAEPSTPELAARLADDGNEPGQLARARSRDLPRLGPWLDEVAARLASGFVLVIDYGYEAAELYGPRRLAGSLLGYRGHRVAEDPFADVGLTDLTAHVDFTALGLLAERRGFVFAGLATQQEFLVAAGLELELQALQASPELTLADYMRARSGILRMLPIRATWAASGS